MAEDIDIKYLERTVVKMGRFSVSGFRINL
jgi:hypothetical protein